MLGKAPLTSRDVMMRLIESMSTTASCLNMASSGDLPSMAPHMVGGTARCHPCEDERQDEFGFRGGTYYGPPAVWFRPVAFLVQPLYQVCPIGWYVCFSDGDIPQVRGQVSP